MMNLKQGNEKQKINILTIIGEFQYDQFELEDLNLPQLGPYLYNDNSVYYGQYNHGMRQGRGKIFYPNGSIYEGYFINDNIHGRGRIIDVDNNVFEG